MNTILIIFITTVFLTNPLIHSAVPIDPFDRLAQEAEMRYQQNSSKSEKNKPEPAPLDQKRKNDSAPEIQNNVSPLAQPQNALPEEDPHEPWQLKAYGWSNLFVQCKSPSPFTFGNKQLQGCEQWLADNPKWAKVTQSSYPTKRRIAVETALGRYLALGDNCNLACAVCSVITSKDYVYGKNYAFHDEKGVLRLVPSTPPDPEGYTKTIIERKQ